MRVIKLGIISLVFFAIFLTGLSLFFPSNVRISKAVDIRTEKDSLLALLSNPVNWKKWYPGADTADLLYVAGEVKGIITGELSGLLMTSVTDSSVSAINAGTKSRKGESGWNIFPGGAPNTYTVQWYMDFHLRWYPWEKFSSLLLEKRYGAVMEKGLEQLKASLEK